MTLGFRPLATAVAAAHVADQIALAALPLILTAAGASPGIIGAVVAAQSAAWLLISLPAGALADRLSRRRIMQAGALLIIAGAASGLMFGASPLALGLAGFLISAGVVLEVLSVFALLPRIATGHGIAQSNAVLEFCRAAAALSAPLLAAYAIARGHGTWVFGVALAAGLISLIATLAVPHDAPAVGARPSLLASIRDGARFVRDQPILRAIALCAIFWNSAFFVMTAVLAPYATRVAGLSVEAVGQAWSIYGVGLLLGALVAPVALKRLHTGFLFVFGPVSSFAGVALVALMAPTYGFWPMAVGLFSLGFAPMLWLVLQTSVRQILTPPDMLGRVAATITTAIYGIRPLAALLAGYVASSFGVTTALWMAVGFFAVSLAAIIWSPAPSMHALPTSAAKTGPAL
jgi:predicted MFS family arabinose efflux permease